MALTPRSEDEAARAITRLVDGTLSDAEREAVEAWAAASPEISRQVLAQRRMARELAIGGPLAPDRLLDAVRRSSRPSGSRASPPGSRMAAHSPSRLDRVTRGASRWSTGWRPAAALGALAALAVVIVIAAGRGGSSTSPSITAAARLAFAQATESAPTVSNASYLDVSYHGLTFPNYAHLDAVATGQLVNRIGGRPALTVFYRLRNGARLSYTVFSGKPVELPAAAHVVRYDGVPLRVYRTSDGLSVVTLVRHGRTCVLAAATPRTVVLALAAEPVLVAHA
jgi:anti-sigma factor RsiW